MCRERAQHKRLLCRISLDECIDLYGVAFFLVLVLSGLEAGSRLTRLIRLARAP